MSFARASRPFHPPGHMRICSLKPFVRYKFAFDNSSEVGHKNANFAKFAYLEGPWLTSAP